jgi:hypothetical protein
MTLRDQSSMARARRRLSRQELIARDARVMAHVFQALAVLGLLAVLGCFGVALHAFSHWYWGSR